MGFGVLICYEAIFPDEVRRFVAGGAQFLVNITNDAWYGRSAAPYQHLAMAAVRAVENGVYLVRAANTGISAVVHPSGRILAQSDIFVPAVVTARFTPTVVPTPYTRFGDVFVALCALVLVAVAAWRQLSRGRRGSP